MPRPGDLVLLVGPKGKRYLRLFEEGGALHTKDGVLDFAAVAAAGFGGTAASHLGRPYRVLKPTLHDLVKGVRRQTQIIYPKEIGYILVKLGIGPGSRVIEAGSGSGSLTMALAWYCGPEGRVYTYDRRPEFSALCARNLARAGMGANVEFKVKDIAEGFEETGVDALFLDVRTPWDYLDQAAAAVTTGAPLGFILPTTGQVSELVAGMEGRPFEEIEVLEIMLRRWKPVPDRLRPEDRMVAHTGFLVFARHAPGGSPVPTVLPEKPEWRPGEPAPESDPEDAPDLDPADTEDGG